MQFQVDSQNSGTRLDVFLANAMGQSRNVTQKLIDDGRVKVNKVVAFKTGIKLQEGDEVEAGKPKATPQPHLKASPMDLDILYEDDEILVINKPAGIVVHPDSTGHHENTIANALLHHLRQLGSSDLRPGIVHRLDKDTSGVLLLAKTPLAHHRYAKLFHDRKVHKEYLALVRGTPKTSIGRIEAPIKRDSHIRQQMAISKGGKRAVSTFKVLESFGWASLLRVTIETGRTHQIRLHLASIGHPVLGDPVYGDSIANDRAKKELDLKRQFLHAQRLEIDGKVFEAPLPEDLEQARKFTPST